MENKRDFDSMAPTWDENPYRVALARAVAQTIIDNIPLNGQMEAMDYGSGTGLVTLYLRPHVAGIVAADSSQGMLDVLQQKINDAGITNVSTMPLNLESDLPPQMAFDLITSSMTIHHIADPAALINIFSNMLCNGGWLCIADLDTEDGSFHADMTGVHHKGFDRREMMDMFKEAGLRDVSAHTAHTFPKPTPDGALQEFSVFLVIGRKSRS